MFGVARRVTIKSLRQPHDLVNDIVRHRKMASKKNQRRSVASSKDAALGWLKQGRVSDAVTWAECVGFDSSIEDSIAAAKIFREAGLGEKVVDTYRRLRSVQPEERVWKIALVCAMAENSQISEMNAQLNEISLTNVEKKLVASALISGGEVAAAASLYQEVINSEPRDEEAVIQLAAILCQKGQRFDAVHLLKELLQHPLSNDAAAAQVWFNLGVASEELEPAESESAYRKSLELLPDYDRPVANLGILLTRSGRLQDAIEFLKSKSESKVDWPRTAMLLASAHRLEGDQTSAIKILNDVVNANLESEQMELAWEMLIRCLIENGETESAIQRCEAWQSQMPNSPIAWHMLAAIKGTDAPSRASSDYVAQTFDGFADSFDAVLTNLKYQAPQLIGKLVHESLGEPAADRVVLDAGCGTGLAGPLLRPFASTLIGVDLSAGMLAHAKSRGVYDQLAKVDLIEHLLASEGKYGLIAAADTFNYFGDLSRLLPACFSALTETGWLVFTLEFGETYGETWQLEAHGRYSHPPSYLMEQLGRCGIEEGEMHKAVLRKENDADVEGLLVAVQNPTDGHSANNL